MIIQLRPSTYLIFIMIIFICSCKKESTTAPDITHSSSIYFNSFESSADTVGWQGYGTYTLYADAPRAGGRQSLYVSGGCIVPHAWINFQNNSSSSYIKLCCWGKRVVYGGGVSLSVLNNLSKSIYCQITDSAWTYYESADSIFCASGDTLHLELISGGDIFNAMLIDLVKVTKIK